MGRVLMDIGDEISPPPGLYQWDFCVRCYASDLFENYILSTGLTMWNSASKLKGLAEKDLLLGDDSWESYSQHGNSLIYTDDISRRMFGRKPMKYEKRDWLRIQAVALKQASDLVLETVRSMTEGDGPHE